MKKTYERPEIQIELFKLDDVIMESSAGTQNPDLATVGNGNETEELFFTP